MFSFFKKNKNQKFTAGFTLIEMVTVIAIFVIVTGIVLANLPNFRSKSSLDLVAQEVAIQIRGAQTYAMSTLVGGGGDTKIFGYAIKTPGTGQQFSLYKLTDASLTLSSDPVESYLISGNFSFVGNEQLMKFKRPTGEAILSYNPTCIKIQSGGDASQYRNIVVRSSGQISVAKDCPAS